MIDVKMDKSKCLKLELQGNIYDITAETLAMIKSIYSALFDQDKDAADLFEIGIKRIVSDSEAARLFKPWSKEDDAVQ